MTARRTDRLPVSDAEGRRSGSSPSPISCGETCAARGFLGSPVFWVGAVLRRAAAAHGRRCGRCCSRAFPAVEPVVYNRDSFLALFLSQLGLVAAASLGASLVGVALAIFVTRPAGREFRAMVNALATIGQTFPPAAVLAIAVPMVGFGARPTVIALFLYGLLPIIENAVAGLEGVPSGVREAAEGHGVVGLAAALASRNAAGCPGHPRRDPQFR